MMGRRPFRYGTLLRVRQRQEDIKALALAETRRKIHAAERHRSEISAQQAAALDSAGEHAKRRFDASEVMRFYLYERHLSRLAVEKDAEIAQLRGEEEERRAVLEDAMKSRKMLERLKERKEEALAYELGKDEQKRMDEAATNRVAAPPNGSPMP